MSDYRRTLPPMSALVAFEAAARRMSFTRAAVEIGVTQAAVSRQIQSLETHLGFPLFLRRHRSLELTERGGILARALSESLANIATAVGAVSGEPQPEQLVISASVAFSHFWLLPRLTAFRRDNPSVQLRLVAQDEAGDLRDGDTDLAIRYGEGRWPDGKASLLLTDHVYPVCSPDYIALKGRPDCAADLAGHRLIAAHPQEANWLDWARWTASFGLPGGAPEIALTCNFYTDAVQAALSGAGIALGWHRLIEHLVADGRLIRVATESWQIREAHYLVLNRERRHRPMAAAFVDWITAAAAALPPLDPAPA